MSAQGPRGDGLIQIPRLDVLAAEYADTASKPFSEFGQDPSASPVLKGKVNFWLNQVYTQFDQPHPVPELVQDHDACLWIGRCWAVSDLSGRF